MQSSASFSHRRHADLTPIRILSTLVLLLVPWQHTYAAEEKLVALAPFVQPVAHVYPGVNSAFLGIELGMPYEAARTKLAELDHAKEGKVDREDNGALSIEHQGAIITSKPYPAWLRYLGSTRDSTAPSRSLTLWFGTPATGSTVTGINRIIQYPTGTGPDPAKAAQDLVQLFGPPSAASRIQLDRSEWRDTISWEFGTSGSWMFKVSGLRTCSSGNCQPAAPVLLTSDRRLSSLEKQVDGGSQVLVTAIITSDPSDPARTLFVAVSMEDVLNEVLTLREARKQLEAAAAGQR